MESEIPAYLLYEAGWPVCMPTSAEAWHLASVRRRVAETVGNSAGCLVDEEVLARCAALMQLHAQRQQA